MHVADQILELEKNPPLRIAWGQITDVGPPLGVRIARDGSDVLVTQWLSSYTPATTDKVVLVKAGQQWIVIGKLVSS